MASTILSQLSIIVLVVFNIRCLSETIECPNAAGCSQRDIHCNTTSTNTNCQINCNEDASCLGSTVYCASDKHCNVQCSSTDSCKEITVHCPQTGGHTCNINGIGPYSLHNINLDCNGSICTVSCLGTASCLNGTFDGYYPDSTMNIECNDTAIDDDISPPNFACKNINLHCPQSKDGVKQCSVKQTNAGNVSPQMEHTALNIYAVNSWNDINLSQYETNISSITSLMHCGSDFHNLCSIQITANNQWNCVNQSSSCWVDISSDDHQETDDYGLAIGLSIAAFFCVILALCIGLYFKQDEEIFAEEYEAGKKLKTPSISKELDDEHVALVGTDMQEYKRMMQLVFYTFAGYQPWAKKRQMYMQTKELQIFLDIVNIQDEVEQVLKLIDTDIEDGRLTLNEWMDYFVDESVNPNIFVIKQHIESQITWCLLCKALKIFEITDTSHTGKLEYSEFGIFGASIGLDEQETELLWNTLDTDQSGAIDIVELFEWFRLRLYQQKGRISAAKQPSLLCSKSDLCDLEEFRTLAKRLSIINDKQ